MHEVMASIEKPIIAQVNGDIIRSATNIVLAADLIVAGEDAKFVDTHIGTGEDDPQFGLVPGDGGLSLVPLFMSPPLAKEFLMLAKEYTMKELAEWGIINYAAPAGEVDAVVNDLVQGLLRRPAYPIAWAKRVANRHVIDQLNRTLDAVAGYDRNAECGMMNAEPAHT
jgi:enoyl-CoA hydratase